MTISPSSTQRAGSCVSKVSTSSGKYRLSDFWSRLWIRISSPSRKTSARNPSHLGSNIQSSPSGNSPTRLASMGRSGGFTGSCTPHGIPRPRFCDSPVPEIFGCCSQRFPPIDRFVETVFSTWAYFRTVNSGNNSPSFNRRHRRQVSRFVSLHAVQNGLKAATRSQVCHEMEISSSLMTARS